MAIDKPIGGEEFEGMIDNMQSDNPMEDIPEFSEEDLMVELDDLEGEDPEIIEHDDGSLEIVVYGAGAPVVPVEHGDNLVELLDESDRKVIASELITQFDEDCISRREWMETYVDGLELLGLKMQEKTEPWDGACGVFSSVLSEAAVRFQAETMIETFPASGPVRTKIIGAETKQKLEAAERVRNDMNYQLTEKMDEYRTEHERMLFSLSLSGCAFKKVYQDPLRGRQVAMYVSSEDVIVPYGAPNLNNAERVTHIMRKTALEMESLMDSGFYRKFELTEPSKFTSDVDEVKSKIEGFELHQDDRYAVYEMQVYMSFEQFDNEDMDEDKRFPYIVTIDQTTNDILSIYRNWEEGDPRKLKEQHMVAYHYMQGFGFYGLGLIHLVGGYARAGTAIIQQLVDAGTLSNLPGGLKTRGMRVKNEDELIRPGEWRDVDVGSGTLRESMLPLPYKEPSQTLLALLERITEEGRRLGAVADLNISDMSANAPVGTTLAILERTLKPMTAVQARIHHSMKVEFKLLKAIIAENTDEDYGYEPTGEEGRFKRLEDYRLVEVIPVSDPNTSTMAQRVTQYQAALQMAEKAPQLYDLPELHRQMLETLGLKNVDKLIPSTEDVPMKDPISENMDVMVGRPVKAYIFQDHEAHIAAHVSLMQNPQIMAQMGQNPMAQQMMASLHAHIAEHMAFKYRDDVEKQLGVPMLPPGEEMPPEMELQLSRVTAQASAQVTGQAQREAAAQQAMAQAQDPMVQMQQAEQKRKDAQLQLDAQAQRVDEMLKMREANRKDFETKTKAFSDQQKIDLDREEMRLNTQLSNQELESTEDIERARMRLQQIQQLQAFFKGGRVNE